MDTKWIALGLFVTGILAIYGGYRLDDKSSFTSGWFIVEIILIVVGIALIAAGIVWGIVLLFIHV